jgi:hypothetical protein
MFPPLLGQKILFNFWNRFSFFSNLEKSSQNGESEHKATHFRTDVKLSISTSISVVLHKTHYFGCSIFMVGASRSIPLTLWGAAVKSRLPCWNVPFQSGSPTPMKELDWRLDLSIWRVSWLENFRNTGPKVGVKKTCKISRTPTLRAQSQKVENFINNISRTAANYEKIMLSTPLKVALNSIDTSFGADSGLMRVDFSGVWFCSFWLWSMCGVHFILLFAQPYLRSQPFTSCQPSCWDLDREDLTWDSSL